MFDWLYTLLRNIIEFFYGATHSYGIAIILLTILIKLVLYPLTIKQINSMREMAKIQPLIKELQQKYKGNPQELNKKTMELYKEHGVNPFGGCLPLLIQLPILWILFRLLNGYNFGGAKFLGLWDLSKPDPLYILPVLIAILSFLQQKVMSPGMEESSQNKMMLILMPLFIGYISIKLPTGVVLYWGISSLLDVILRYYIDFTSKKNALETGSTKKGVIKKSSVVGKGGTKK